MDKFRGHTHCTTWNFGGNHPAATLALGSRKVCVSKNVCHRTRYTDRTHAVVGVALQAARAKAGANMRARSLEMMHTSMGADLRTKPGGKMLHDPLALATALDESVCTLAEVRLGVQSGAVRRIRVAPAETPGEWGEFVSIAAAAEHLGAIKAEVWRCLSTGADLRGWRLEDRRAGGKGASPAEASQPRKARRGWGSTLCAGTGIWITVDYD